jgi:predicted SAM-dependent methyltransferase
MKKLHVGCGTRILSGYDNIDIQNYNNDKVIISDISDLSGLYEANSIDVIYSCANIEHFGRKEWIGVVEHWYSLLKPGGVLRISTADFQACVDRYLVSGKIEEVFGLIVGGQKDDYDWHGMIFDYTYMKRELSNIGFKNIKRYDWRETEHSNVDDFSQAYIPHMDKENGALMMLNLECEK